MQCKCGAKMIPLATSNVCADECDKKPKTEQPAPKKRDGKCPRCQASDVEGFPLPGWEDALHCWDCGSVF